MKGMIVKNCGNCKNTESAPSNISRIMGSGIRYCPIHRVYVRVDENACPHHSDRNG